MTSSNDGATGLANPRTTRPRVAVVDPSNFTIPYDIQLASALIRRGADARLICRNERLVEGRISNIPAERMFYRLSESHGAHGNFGSTLKGIEHVADTAAFLWHTRKAYDIIHYQWLVLPSIDGFILPRLAGGRPVVLTVHDTAPLAGSARSRLQTFGLYRAMGSMAKLVVHTGEGRERLIDAGIPADKIVVLPHPVLPMASAGLEHLPSCAARWERAPHRMLLFGHLKPYKGIDVLLSALEIVPRDLRDNLQVMLAGKSAYKRDELQGMIAARNLDEFVTVDERFLNDSELAALVCRATVLLFPYTQIDASGAILSVLPLGKPMILSALPSVLEVFPRDDDAIHVTPGDAGQLCSAILSCLTDPDRLHRMAAAAVSAARRLPSWDDMADGLLRVYTQALEEAT